MMKILGTPFPLAGRGVRSMPPRPTDYPGIIRVG